MTKVFRELGDRLRAGRQILVLTVRVRILLPQPPFFLIVIVDVLLEFSKDEARTPRFWSNNFQQTTRLLASDGQRISEIERAYISANETNFLAFNLATEEYHNELYEKLAKILRGKAIKRGQYSYLLSETKSIINKTMVKQSTIL